MVPREPQRTTVGGVASIPSRASMLERMVASALPQVDRLAVYLNGYDDVPAFLRNERVSVARSQELGDRGDAGKFFAAAELREGAYFALDDDIIYPPNYVAHMLARLRELEGRAVLGVHGIVYARRPTSFFDRRVIQFPEANDRLRPVSLVGTGTACFDLQTVPVTPEVFETGSMADLWFGAHVKALGVPMVCVDRPADWLTSIPPTQADSLWRVATNDSGPHERLVRAAGPWGRADLVGRADAAGLASSMVADWLRIPDLIDVVDDPAGAVPGEWPAIAPDWTDAHVSVYFDDLEHLELARAMIRDGQPIEHLGRVLVKAAEASVPEAAEAADAALAASGPDEIRVRPGLAAVAVQLWRRSGQAERALEVYDRSALTTPNVERERAMALLELGRPEDAVRAIAFSPWAVELPLLLAVARALAAGRLGDIVPAALAVASSPEAWYLRRPVPVWLRRWDGAGATTTTSLSADLGELERAGEGSAFDHACWLRVLQALHLDELSRFWLHRFGHRLAGGPQTPGGAMLRAQLQPSGAEARAELDALWRRAGLAGVAETDADGAATHVWSTMSFDPGPTVHGDDLVSLIVAPDPTEDDSATLAAAVASAVAQRYAPLEVIVVSRAGTSADDALTGGDGRVRVVEVAPGTGRAACRNAALDAATGRYVAVHDVGTWAHPERLVEQLRLLRTTTARAAVAPVFRVDDDGVPAADPESLPLTDVGGSLLVERALIDELGPFDASADAGDGADAEMLARIERRAGHATVVRLQVPLLIATVPDVDPAADHRASGRARRDHYFGARAVVPTAATV